MPRGPDAAEAQRARLHQAAVALETMVVKQLVTTSKAFTGGEGPGSAVRADLFADALADAMVKGGGIGLAKQIERSMAGPASSPARSTSTVGDALVTSAFGPRHDPFDGHLTRHEGVDLAGDEGAEVRAPRGGVVRRAGERGGYGQALEIDHGDGVVTVYGHASELLVGEGDRVDPGQPILRVGSTGRATGAHLHFEVRVGGRPVDPGRALKIYGLRAEGMIESGS
ncbi:MAG TPA: peptidoglycan DD-metalloendopeptidase family protein [Anaeromyxobacteraceae bacterium]|nr:peptidoglycan DD-metalloendopeptidase family protein [Anaeromyxobacteraceae bacterium]